MLCIYYTCIFVYHPYKYSYLYTLTYRYFLVWAIGSLLKVLRANLIVTKETRLVLSSLGLSTPVADNKEKSDYSGELEPGKCSLISQDHFISNIYHLEFIG
jgi:hypothetical protein